MWLFPIYVLVLYGVPIAVLGAINLFLVPAWRVTLANLLVFVLGGFLGIFALANAVKWLLQEVASHWRWGSHGKQGDDLAFYIVVAIGAELGGIGLTYVKSRLWGSAKEVEHN